MMMDAVACSLLLGQHINAQAGDNDKSESSLENADQIYTSEYFIIRGSHGTDNTAVYQVI